MSSRPTQTLDSNKRSGDAPTSRTVTEHEWSVSDMRTVADESHAPPTEDRCPKCNTPGWVTANGRYTAVCGSFWDADGRFEFTSPACWMLEHRQDQIDELQHALREATGEAVAA